ncbi:hypothetical protein MJT46_005293 [Ovis ammon polii x Ovis aries]|nr:hypothetical protein MJT46_005293 [Ovis ammon polii x Ovis aries]
MTPLASQDAQVHKIYISGTFQGNLMNEFTELTGKNNVLHAFFEQNCHAKVQDSVPLSVLKEKDKKFWIFKVPLKAFKVPQIKPLERHAVDKTVNLNLLAKSKVPIQDALNANDTTKESGGLMHENDRERQQDIQDGYKGERNGSEWAEVGGKSSSTGSVLVNEKGNTEDLKGGTRKPETYDQDGIQGKEDSITANGLRGQVSIIHDAGAANGSHIDGITENNSQNAGVGNTSQSEDATVVQEDGHQVAGSSNSTGQEVEINGNSCRNGADTSETTPQRDERNGNEEAGVLPGGSGAGNGEDVGLDNFEGSPSGNGADEDEDKGSGDDEGKEIGNGEKGSDISKGQEGQSHGEEDDEDNSLGQNSVSSEDDGPGDKEDAHVIDGDNISKSEEDSAGIPENNDSQKTEDTQKPSHRENKAVENRITEKSEPPAIGKSHNKGMEMESPSSGHRNNVTKEAGKVNEDKESKGQHGMIVGKGNVKRQGEIDIIQGAGQKLESGNKLGPSKTHSDSNSDGYDSYEFDGESMQGDDPNSSDESNGSDDANSEGRGDIHGYEDHHPAYVPVGTFLRSARITNMKNKQQHFFFSFQESSESSEESKLSSEEQANEDPSDSTESEEVLGPDGQQHIHRPAGGLSRRGGSEGDNKDDDEDESGDDTFGDDDGGPGPEERRSGGDSRLGSDEDSADTTQSREDSAPQGDEGAHDTTSESRDLDREDEGNSRPEGGDSTPDSESEEHWVGGGSEGDSSHGDGSEFDDEGMQSDDPGAYRSERGNSRISGAGLESRESKGDDEEQASTQDSHESPAAAYPRRKFFRKSRLPEEDGRGELDDSRTTEVMSDSTENPDSKEAGLGQSREHGKSESRQESEENRSPEDSQDVQDPSSESSQEVDLPSQENSSESQEEALHESRGDNPDNATSHSREHQADSESSEEDVLDKPSDSESTSTEEQADSESDESLRSSEESPESTEEQNSSSQEGGQTQSRSQESPSEEDDGSDSQDSSRSKEDSNSTESVSSSEEEALAKNTEVESRKLTVDAYHNKPIGDQDDNDCQDGY